jgi:hypothetical protein
MHSSDQRQIDAEGFDQALGQRRHLRVALDLGARDELVPTEPSHGVLGPHHHCGPPRHLDENAVAHCMAGRVVDRLEAIDVPEENGDD